MIVSPSAETPYVSTPTDDADSSHDAGDDHPGFGLYWVAVFLVDLAYGGPEEGGWWYPAGTLVIDPALYETLGAAPAGFWSIEAAQTYAGSMRAKLPGINLGRPDISQTNSVGIYEVRVMRAQVMPTQFPIARPHYE